MLSKKDIKETEWYRKASLTNGLIIRETEKTVIIEQTKYNHFDSLDALFDEIDGRKYKYIDFWALDSSTPQIEFSW